MRFKTLRLGVGAVVICTAGLGSAAIRGGWSLAPIDNFSFSTAPSRPRVMYAWGSGVWRSDDGGSHWLPTAESGPSTLGVIAFAIDPSDADRLFAQVRLETAQGPLWQFIVSADGGQTWAVAGTGLPGDPIAALAVDDRDPAVLYAEARLALWKSIDGGANWFVLSGPGAPGGCTPPAGYVAPVPCPALAVGEGTPSRVYAADAAGVHRSDDGGATWQLTALTTEPGEEIRQLVVASDDARTVLASSSVYQGVWASADRGETWTKSASPEDDVPFALALDYTRSSRIYAAGGGDLLASDDVGTTWRHIGAPGLRFSGLMENVAVSSLGIAITHVFSTINEVPSTWTIRLTQVVPPPVSKPAPVSGRP